MAEAIAYRVTAVHFAKDAGMTNQAIGEHLHLSEARVRQILAGE
jgi:DNA-directed RNA polymerase sigma subunit (sigma70/sigma32)